ncbi:MAG: Holliday junction resolvase RuvX [Microbacteriaceae bacterium]|nr:Holliday junction resolvase RuvX [Microbacteriaceae bacterium]
MRPGRRVAIDFGQSRVGLAVSDQQAILASPLGTFPNSDDLSEIIQSIPEDVIEVYVGLPTSLKGGKTASTSSAVAFASQMQKALNLPVRLVDERLTTSLSHARMREVGKSQRESKGFIDQLAAVAILESAMTAERLTGQIPGVSVEDWKSQND